MKVSLNRMLLIGASVMALAMANGTRADDDDGDDASSLPNCTGLVFGGVKFKCIAAGEPTVVTTTNLNEPTGVLDLCTCNATLEECDPNLTSEDGDSEHASELQSCLSGGQLQAVPSEFGLIPDGTGVCRTIGGEKQCWK